MNRRDLFKRAGKLGAGLGLAAVVGTTVHEDEPEGRSRFTYLSRGAFSTQTNPTLVLGTPKPVTEGVSGASSPAWEVRQDIHGVTAESWGIEAHPITESTTLTGTQTYGYSERQGGAL